MLGPAVQTAARSYEQFALNPRVRRCKVPCEYLSIMPIRVGMVRPQWHRHQAPPYLFPISHLQRAVSKYVVHACHMCISSWSAADLLRDVLPACITFGRHYGLLRHGQPPICLGADTLFLFLRCADPERLSHGSECHPRHRQPRLLPGGSAAARHQADGQLAADALVPEEPLMCPIAMSQSQGAGTMAAVPSVNFHSC